MEKSFLKSFKGSISRTGSVGKSLEEFKKKGISKQEFEEPLKELIGSDEINSLVQSRQNFVLAKSFFLKFLLACIVSGVTVIVGFLVF